MFPAVLTMVEKKKSLLYSIQLGIQSVHVKCLHWRPCIRHYPVFHACGHKERNGHCITNYILQLKLHNPGDSHIADADLGIIVTIISYKWNIFLPSLTWMQVNVFPLRPVDAVLNYLWMHEVFYFCSSMFSLGTHTFSQRHAKGLHVDLVIIWVILWCVIVSS